jgi:hypothetical protein
MNTGWTWDYVLWQVDLPILAALTAYWQTTPPIALQLSRISSWLGLKPLEKVGAGMTAPRAGQPADQAAAPVAADPAAAQAESLMSLFPSATTAVKVMSSEEYLRRKHVDE